MLDRELVKKAIKECKKEAGLDFAYSQATACCMGCTNSKIASQFGDDAHGIFVKWFRAGMNGSNWSDYKTKHICHTLTKEQGEKVVEVLSRYFKVTWSGEEHDCIEIGAKEDAA